MADKRMTYIIGLEADASRLLSAVNEAMKSLRLLNSGSIGTHFLLTDEIREAAIAASELEAHMRNAINPQTGQFDLMSFEQNLRTSGQSLEQYGQKLISTGRYGQEAFIKVALAINQAELPVKRTTKLMDSLWVTMKNTMRWLLTTSMLRGFLGSILTAYNYTKDLNESLNNIRIVTLRSTEDMAGFARLANEAAKALSTTTTEYTDASLIYYQQGLTDKEVTSRTDTTIKLANVTRLSAETVSEQMTAIWNNFAEGSENLEHYADVITALGATTASSSAEIAEGVQKFAAVASSVGLSYEYATSALATLVALTRESPDIIGTSLRTLFARIQGLTLDEELEDGTNLNKYSKALAEVGVNIKDVNGDMKSMNDILDETAARWTTLSRNQQLALAQTVAGVRQYTQFVSLMNNWDKFQENLQTAYTSDGALLKLADVYAESWEAARNRVKASAEDIYDSLFDESTFIAIDKGLVTVLDLTADVVKGFGGLLGILTSIGAIMFKVYGDLIAQSMRNMAALLSVLSGIEKERLRTMQDTAAQLAQSTPIYAAQQDDPVLLNRAILLREHLLLQKTINDSMDNMNSLEKEYVKNKRGSIEILREEAEETNHLLDVMQERVNAAREKIFSSNYADVRTYNLKKDRPTTWFVNDLTNKVNLGQFRDAMGLSGNAVSAVNQIFGNTGDVAFGIENIINRLQELYKYNDVILKLSTAFKDTSGNVSDVSSELGQLARDMGLVNEETGAIENLNEKLNVSTQYANVLKLVLHALLPDASEKDFSTLNKALLGFATLSNNALLRVQGLKNTIDQFIEDLQSGKVKITDWSIALTTITQSAFQLSTSLTAISNIHDLLTSNEDLPFAEKVTRFLSSSAMLAPTIISTFKGLGSLSSLNRLGEVFLTAAAGAVQAGATAGSFSANMAGVSAAVTAAAGPVMAIVAIISALTLVITKQIAVQKEMTEARRQEAYEAEKASREEVLANRDILRSMQEALETYKTSGDNKEELDSITQSLADAYDLEGAAIARLSGKYEDYNKVLLAAKDNQREELLERRDTLLTAYNEALGELLDTAREGSSNYLDPNGRYHASFSGGMSLEDETEAVRALQAYLPQLDNNGQSFSVNIDGNNIQELIDLYDNLSLAQEQMKNNMSPIAMSSSEIYTNVSAWLAQMEEIVNRYRDLNQEITTLNILLGEYGNLTINDNDISDLREYRQWINQVSTALGKAGYEGEALDNAILLLIDSSVNPRIKEFLQLADAIEDAKSLVDPTFIAQLDEILSSGDYDTRVLGNINWTGMSSEAEFLRQYDNLLKYQEALDKATISENRYKAAKEAVETLGDDGTFTDESLMELSLFNWGDAEQGIISFNEFLRASKVELQQYLHELMDMARNDTIEGIHAEIDALQEQLAEERSIYESRDEARLESSYNQVEAYNRAKDAYDDYMYALENNEPLDAVTEKLLNIDWSKLGVADWYDFVDQEAVRTSVEEAVGRAQGYINRIEASKESIDLLEDSINSKGITVQVWAELQYQDALNDIISSVDPLVEVFDILENEVQRATNSAGESMWAFSREATIAMESIYPGFMQTAQLLEDGTFALTDDMYNAFFNSTNGIVAANADGMALILDNEIAILLSKKENAQSAIEIAKQLKEGEIGYSQLTNELKGILLGAYLDAQQANSDDLLTDNVDLLDAEQGNWSTMWKNVSGFSAQAGTNMADNIADGTASVLENLKAIRDAAYQAGLLVSLIGSDMFTATEQINTTVNRMSGGSHVNIEDIDTSNGADAFLDSLAHEVTGRTYEELLNGQNTGVLLDQVADAMISAYEQSVGMLDAQINANLVAKSKLLGAIDSTMDGYQKRLEDEQKAANKGSSSKSKEEKVKDPKEEAKLEEKALKDLEDRYHEINRAIKDQSELLDDINEKMDLAYGKSRLNQFGNKIELLNKQAENFKGKMSLASHFIEVDKQALKDTLGLTDEAFDPDTGELLHYQDILEDIMDDYNVFIREYNAFVDKYNAATAEEQEQLEKQLETLKKQKEVYDDMYDTKLELLDKYEESLDEYLDALNEYEQKMREIEDAKLEEITYKMEVILEVKEAKDWVREFTRDIAESLGDELYHTLAAPQLIGGKGTAILDYEQAQAEVDLLSSYQEEYDALVQRLNEANEYTNINDIKDAFLELEQNIIDSGEAILEWIDSIETLLPNAIDAARKRFDQFTDQLAHNTTMLETIRELYVLQGQTYKTQLGFDRLQRTTKERMDAATANAILNKEWSLRAKKDLDIAQAALESLVAEYGGDEIAAEEDARYDTFKANRDALLLEFNEAQEAMYQSAQEAMEAAKDMYLELIERAVYEFGQELSDDQGLDLLQDKYDHYIEENSRYFDRVNEAYLVSYWYNKLLQDIDKSNNALFTQKLKDLLAEIDLRREGNTLSEYDMEILEAKYKVLQAQMALEDAMNNKDELRLVRDRQGNWNYQYVADPDEIMNKQQELLDAENEWYNIAKQLVEDVTGEIIDAWTECQEAIRDIYNDMTLTDEERAARAEEIYRYYTEKIKFLENEKQVALEDMTEAGNKSLFDMAVVMGDAVSDLTGLTAQDIYNITQQTGKDIYDLLLLDWEEILDLVDLNGQNIWDILAEQSQNIKDLMTDNNGQITLFDNTYGTALDNMTKNTAKFEEALEKALTNMQQRYDEYGINVQDVADKTGTSLEDLDQKVNELSDSTDRCRDAGWEMADSLWNILDAVLNLSMEYANLAASIMEAVFAMQLLAAASAALVERAANMDIPSSTPQLPTQSGGGAVSFDVSGLAALLAQAQGLNNVEDLSDEDLAALWALLNGKVDENPDLEKWRGGLVTQGNKALSGLLNGNLDTSKYRDWENLGDALNDPNLPPELRDRWKQYAAGFATGGYTGDFTDGKLAFLHEKELVLNQEDTKNMLAAVSTVRALEPALLKVIESKLDASAQSGVALMSSRLSANSVGTSIREVQLDVHIEAVFPNVTEHNEIIEAFNGLIDEAAQFAFIKQD